MAKYFCDTVTWEGSFEQHRVYAPAKHPGFVAWAAAFTYGDGSIGLSFDERIQKENPSFTPPRLEYAEAAGVPVSYCSAETGSDDQCSYRVYMRSTDGVHFTETGRCPRSEGSFGNAGFPDGRILGFDVPRHNAAGTGWCDYILVRESNDGGSTWKEVRKLFRGSAPYLWRVRRLNDGTIVLLASFYGTAWGPGQERITRNTDFPYETYISKIQTFFVTTKDGYTYSPPNYILPGIGAHEYDFVEMPDGRLVFIAGDVQGTPVGRQIVVPTPDGWMNQGIFPIHAGAPKDPTANPQGGYVPETIAWDEKHQCIVGYRRNNCFSISNDLGANWTRVELDVPFTHLYQPFMLEAPDGRIALLGHAGGGDVGFGQKDMTIECQLMDMDCANALPKPTRLSLERLLSEDGSHFLNEFRARLTCGDAPLAGVELEFRFTDYWAPDGAKNTTPQAAAPLKIRAVTDENGCALAHPECYDNRADIHLAYNVDVTRIVSDGFRRCVSPQMCILALTPYRRCLFPRDAYFAGGTLFLAPQFLQDFPGIMDTLLGCTGESDLLPAGVLPPEAERRLLKSGVLFESDGGALRWIKSIHAPRPLDDVKPMLTGDWYE